MFTISKEAEKYIADLFKEQDEELGLKVEVEMVGTPMANVTFNFSSLRGIGHSRGIYPG
jgi:Fe-S cluster assembly iron-binding protein IscA